MKRDRAIKIFRSFVARHLDPTSKRYEIGGEMYSAYELLAELRRDPNSELSGLFITNLVQGKVTGIDYKTLTPVESPRIKKTGKLSSNQVVDMIRIWVNKHSDPFDPRYIILGKPMSARMILKAVVKRTPAGEELIKSIIDLSAEGMCHEDLLPKYP